MTAFLFFLSNKFLPILCPKVTGVPPHLVDPTSLPLSILKETRRLNNLMMRLSLDSAMLNNQYGLSLKILSTQIQNTSTRLSLTWKLQP